MTVEVFLD